MRDYLQDSKALSHLDHFMQIHWDYITIPPTHCYMQDQSQDKYIALYRELITQLHVYTSAIRILAKGYLPISLATPLKLREILNDVKTAIQKTNPDYD